MPASMFANQEYFYRLNINNGNQENVEKINFTKIVFLTKNLTMYKKTHYIGGMGL